ncbi:MAG: GMC family oxidoreductase, partial [Hyphomicrobiaceae bacterium]
MSETPNYDYIVVGAGSAGAAVAARLAENPSNRVLLLEAGPADNPWTRLPVGYAKLVNNPAANWLYTSEPEPATKGRRLPVPRGKILGGSSAIYGLAFVRGEARDFDTWAQLGNSVCSYEDVLPDFKGMESYHGRGEVGFRGQHGPLQITTPTPSDLLYRTIIEAAGEVGIPHNPDYNGASQEGIAMSQASIYRRRRMSTAQCYLEPIRHRSNLIIETNALTHRVLLDGKRCIGVAYTIHGKPYEAHAGREVIIS